MTKTLEDFIAHARSKQMDHSTIRMLLLSAGWKEKEIAQALSAEGLDMDVPMPPDVGGAREGFLHLLNFAALYTLVISSIILFFHFINRVFPDAAERTYSASSDFSGIRMSMAAMIVALPILLWMTRMIHRDIAAHPQKALSGIRRWLTYITLFVAATTLMVDVITLVFSLLEGELSVRFLLKVATVFLLAGSTFAYYFLSLKSSVVQMRRLNTIFLMVACAITAFAMVWGIVIVGSPVTGRQQKFDEVRLQDLRSIQSEIYTVIYDDRSPRDPLKAPEPVKPLPATLADLQRQALYSRPSIVDPQTGEPYEYTVKDAESFQLCATFNFAREERYDVFWNHPEGRHCYEFDTANRNYL